MWRSNPDAYPKKYGTKALIEKQIRRTRYCCWSCGAEFPRPVRVEGEES